MQYPALQKTILEIHPDHDNGLYLCGEDAVFTVTARKEGKPVSDGLLTVLLGQDGGPSGTEQRTFDLSRENPVHVTARMTEPCFLLCQAFWNGLHADRAVYYRTEAQARDLIRRNLLADSDPTAAGGMPPEDPPIPEDFQAFWQKTLQKARALSGEPELEPLEQYSRRDAAYYRISMDSLNGERVHGFLGLPAGQGPFPMLVLFPGAGPGFGHPVDCGWTARGCITVMMNVHKYPVPDNPEEALQKMKQYAAEHEATHYLRAGAGCRETYHFYTVLPGFCRVLDWVTEHYPWDRKHLLMDGSSQGGWLALAMGALYREKISAIYAGVPSTGFRSPYRNSSHMPDLPCPYFDPDYFAPMIQAPVLMTAGFRDTTCPFQTVLGAFRLLGSRDKQLMTDGGEHMVSPYRHFHERKFLTRHLGLSSHLS